MNWILGDVSNTAPYTNYERALDAVWPFLFQAGSETALSTSVKTRYCVWNACWL